MQGMDEHRHDSSASSASAATAPLRIALIGHGAIGRRFAEAVGPATNGAARIISVMTRTAAASGPNHLRARSVDEVIAARPDLVVEAASHSAVRETVPQLLRAGVEVIVASVGALADEATIADLRRASAEGHTRLSFATGAAGSLDALASARQVGLDEVRHTIIKPAAALGLALDRALGAIVVHEGSARDTALALPSNANVVVAVSLVGIGLDRTRVRVLASATATRNTHRIRARGAFGSMAFRIANAPDPANPRTSILAAGSLVAAVVRRVGLIAVA
jgi:aspartate dehydrogenase